MKDFSVVQEQLQKHLSDRFGEVSVQVGNNIHYPGTNVVIVCPRFAGWFAEQRYHHVVRAIPAALYDQYLRDGVVWFELAPGETAKQYMTFPRSEDVAAKARSIESALQKIRFAQRLIAALGPHPGEASTEDFVVTRRVLASAGKNEAEIRNVCLYLIRQGAFCDAHVVRGLVPRLLDQGGNGKNASF